MKLHKFCVVLCLFALVSCGGGQGGNNQQANRHYSITFTPGLAASAHDQTGAILQLEPNALKSAGTVEVEFSEAWQERPVSTLVQAHTIAVYESTTALNSSAVRLSYPYSSKDPDLLLGVVSEDGTNWQPILPTIDTANRIASVSYAYQSRASQTRLGKFKFRIGITSVPYKADLSEKTIELVKLDGSGSGEVITNPSTCVLIHGMNNSVKDMMPLGKKLIKDKTFGDCRLLKYDWTKPIATTARDIAAYLKGHIQPGIKVTLVAHSMGGLHASWITEQEPSHNYIEALVMIGTPRQGTKIATEIDRCLEQAHDNLNNPEDESDHWSGLCALNTASLSDVRPGSPFLNTLNNSIANHRVDVPYLLIAGNKPNWGYGIGEVTCLKHYANEPCDGLLPSGSLLNYNYTGHQINGAITKLTWYYNHGQLIANASAQAEVSKAIKKVLATPGPRVAITRINANAHDDGWDVTYTVTNHGTIALKTNKFVIAMFNARGDWDTTQWYNPSTPNGQFFPTFETEWKHSLQPGESYTITAHTCFDYNRNDYNHSLSQDHRKTVYAMCAGAWSDGRAFGSSIFTKLLDKDGTPPQTPTRAVDLFEQKEGGRAQISAQP